MHVEALNKSMAAAAVKHLSKVLRTGGRDALTTEWLAFKAQYGRDAAIVGEVAQHAAIHAPSLAAAISGTRNLEDIAKSVSSAVEMDYRRAKEFLLNHLKLVPELPFGEMISWLAKHGSVYAHPEFETVAASNSVRLSMCLTVSQPPAEVLTAYFNVTDPDLEKPGAIQVSNVVISHRALAAMVQGKVLEAEPRQ